MVRQMLRKVRVMDPGDSDILPGTLMDIADFKDRNYNTLVAGGFLLPAAQSYLVSQKHPWKQTASYLLHPSKKQRAC